MKKFILAIASVLVLGTGAFAQEQHFKWYGFIRTYFAFDTRESSAGTEDLYFYMPKDKSFDASGEDINAIPSFRYAALTSRLGLDVLGYEFDGYKIGAKIEADFYSGVSGVTGTAQLRLRQAFATVAKNGRSWKIGQAWHPMAADLPDIFSLESGVPFNPFSRTPQVAFEWSFAKSWSFTAAAIWQMQYTSTGPKFNATAKKYEASASADYLKYGCTPELYLAFNLKTGSSLFRLGSDILSIKPRNYDYDIDQSSPNYGKAIAKVKDRLTTWNAYAYAQTRIENWEWRTKLVYANDGSHMNLVGGYGKSGQFEDGSWSYSATRNLAVWTTFSRKEKNCRWVPQLFLGYSKQFGTSEAIETGFFWGKNSAGSLNRIWRVQPELLYNLGKLQLGFEYMLTGVQYGKGDDHRVVNSDLHTVSNHRVQLMVKYTF